GSGPWPPEPLRAAFKATALRSDNPRMGEPEAVPEVERWCSGLRASGTRPLSAAEIEGLRREVARAGPLAWLPIPIGVVATIALFWLATALRGHAQAQQTLLTIGILMLLFLALPVAILTTLDSCRRVRDARRDLEAGLAETFGEDEAGAAADSVGRRVAPLVLR